MISVFASGESQSSFLSTKLLGISVLRDMIVWITPSLAKA